MWKKISYFQDCFPGKEIPHKHHFPKARFLLDENMPESIGAYLKKECNIKTIREVKAKGASDGIVQQIAKKEGRILITEDNDFDNCRQFPLKSSPGLIIVSSKSALERLTYLLRRMIIPRPHLWAESKIIMHEETLTCHYLGKTGSIETCKLRCKPRTPIAKWED